jgi:hypothetical protein
MKANQEHIEEKKSNQEPDSASINELVSSSMQKQNLKHSQGANEDNSNLSFINNPYLPSVLQSNAERALGVSFGKTNIYRNSSKAIEHQ